MTRQGFESECLTGKIESIAYARACVPVTVLSLVFVASTHTVMARLS